MFEKILVCLDGSKVAEQILPLAETQAKQFNSLVILLQVVPLSNVPVIEAGATFNDPKLLEEQVQQNIQKATAYLESVSQRFQSQNITVKTAIITGAPVGKIILDYAKQNDINLIAIATHGHGGLGRLVFGSVAEYILKESGLPMLVIKPKK